MQSVINTCKKAYENSYIINNMSTIKKNRALGIVAEALKESEQYILSANALDMQSNAEKPQHILDRLMLNHTRLKDMSTAIMQLIYLPDPVGEVLSEWTAKSGIKISKVRVPLGVLGIIYEARPNVTIDALGLALKSGNAVVLRGSKDAFNTNKALVDVVKARLSANGFNPEFIQLVEDITHEGAEALMKCREYISVLLPRGSANLIKSTVQNSTIPVIETGVGNCHAYVEKSADFTMAENIILNGKLQRPSVCNALESILIDEEIASDFLPRIVLSLSAAGVSIVGCEKSKNICSQIALATDEDYSTEFLSLKISVKIVNGVNEAISHINKYGSKHSETIITSNEEKAAQFLSLVDCAAVYHNASTRFTDGFEFGFGAEMGISTQKLHARGPIGLKQLTSEKYKIYGQGQVRK